jgi:AcrR family transcriptional regulator
VDALVWNREDPGARPAPLSREAIVAAAIGLADRDGLDGVSLRKVGAALGAGAMRLYTHVATKDELLELMVDEVYGEIDLADEPSARTIALRTRAVALRHLWFVALHSGRPSLGPNALRHLEAMLHAFDGDGGIDAAADAAGVVHAYVVGQLVAEVAAAAGPTEEQWQQSKAAYLQRMLATGEFPAVARMVAEGSHRDSAEEFERGLDLVLAGLR